MKNWDELAAPWLRAEARIEAAHAPVLAALLAAADLAPGQQVLDVGFGSGLSTCQAAAAVGQDGHVTGVDVAPSFVRRARERVPENVTLIEADAQTYPFAAAHFDRVISLFGVMFFDDTVAAFANIRRAVTPGGLFTMAAWAPPATNPWISVGGQVAHNVLGPVENRPDPNVPNPFRFAVPGVALDALTEAGWQAEVETLDMTLTPTGTPDDLALTQMELGLAARRIADEDPDAEDIEALRSGLADRFATMQNASGAVLVPARIHIFSARA